MERLARVVFLSDPFFGLPRLTALAIGLGLGRPGSVAPPDASSCATPHLEGLVAHWNFAEPDLPYSSCGVGHSLQLAPGATAPIRNPDGFKPGVASLAFDGTDRHLMIPAHQLGNLQMGGIAQGVTVATWIKRSGDTNSAVAGIWQEDTADARRQYALFVNLAKYGGDDRVCGHISSIDGPTPDYPYSRDYSWNSRRIDPGDIDVWRFAVFTYDGAQIRSYLDGAFESTPSFLDEEGYTRAANPYDYPYGMNPASAEFTVGAVKMTGGYGNFLHGEIANLRVWDRALSQHEIIDIYKADKPIGSPLFRDVFRTTQKAASRAMGWRSFLGASCIETTDQVPQETLADLYNFGGAATGNGGYLARTGTAAGVGLGYFDGFAEAPLQWNDVGRFEWVMNNASSSDAVRLAVRVAGQWYASSALFSCTSRHNATDWSGAEPFTFQMTRAAASWQSVDFEPGSSLALGGHLLNDIVGDEIEAFGFFCDEGSQGTIRIGDFDVTSVS